MNGNVIQKKVGFIGGGNMAKAICEGLVRKGILTYSQVYVSGPRLHNLQSWKDKNAHVTTKNGEIVNEADLVFLSVKPHILSEAAASMFDTCNLEKARNKLFISVIAGIKLESLENMLNRLEGSRVVRVMPNTPLAVSEGCVVFCPGTQATENDISLVQSIFQALGMCQMVPESMITNVGALAGSGPAYIYLVIEALSDGGVKKGIPREMATRFAAQTVLGAAKMVLETGKHPGALKDEVCSPGGTTITGIHALERGGVRSAFMDAIECAVQRCEEISNITQKLI